MKGKAVYVPRMNSSEWENTYRKLSRNEILWSHSPEIEDFIPLAKKENAKRILDAGCGDGKNLTALLQETQLYCVGIDGSKTALEVCEREIVKKVTGFNSRNYANKRLNEMILLSSSLENMPFLSDYFDGAICIDVINHNRNPYEIIEELCRVVKREGLIYLSLFNVEDEVLSNPVHAKEMRAIDNGIPDREFIYSFVNSDGDATEYYFRFLHVDEVEDFLAPTDLEIIDKGIKYWKNPPHPHFRPYEHTHCNIMVTARNKRESHK